MSYPSAPPGRGASASGRDEDGWGPSTAVRRGTDAYAPSGNRTPPPRGNGRVPPPAGRAPSRPTRVERPSRLDQPPPPRVPVSQPLGASAPAARRPGGAPPREPAPAAARGEQRRNRLADAQIERSLRDLQQGRRAPERGWPWWAALGVLIVIAVVGGIIDTVGAIQVSGGFNIGIVVASILAILIVKRSHMFPIVIAPPIVYSIAAVFQLYLRSDGLSDKKVVFDAAANYLVYGFPAIAGATAAVLIIAGIRLITRK